MAERNILWWIGFHFFIFGMLALDLGVFHRKTHTVRVKEALIWTGVWVILALIFNCGIYLFLGSHSALEFLTGYLIEKSLSIDNIFIFLMIFSYFKVPETYQYKVLFYGIIGALIMRAFFIFAGIALLARFHWVIYIFGLFLILTGLRLAFEKERQLHLDRNPILRVLRRVIPITSDYVQDRFLIKKKRGWAATPLFVALIVVETTDVIFAVDSIPAILAVTRDPFIVYTSNVLAILGLRSLYFALSNAISTFHFMKYGLAVILVFVGFKMVISDFYKVPIIISLAIIAGSLGISLFVSLFKK